VDTQPSTPAIFTESQGTPFSQYPGPGEIQSSTPTPTLQITGLNPYPTPGNPVFLTSTPNFNFTYPGQATDSFSTPQATFLFPTPQFGTPAGTPTAVPLVTVEARTPVPPPAWINSQLRASDLSDVKLASGSTQLFFFFAFWDGASLAMAPLVHAVEEDYQEQVNFVYLDIDDPAANYFKKELGYVSQPHFFLVDPQGLIIQQWEGYIKIEELIQAIDSALE
jgi:thiol-disulfide isomerase/thioredoxin